MLWLIHESNKKYAKLCYINTSGDEDKQQSNWIIHSTDLFKNANLLMNKTSVFMSVYYIPCVVEGDL